LNENVKTGSKFIYDPETAVLTLRLKLRVPHQPWLIDSDSGTYKEVKPKINDLLFKVKLELMASDDEDFIWIFEHNLFERIKFTEGFARHRSIDGQV
jgi:hypothetical protein